VRNDKRLIENYLPVEAINEVAQREKIGHAALHPRKLHIWWARRPLAAARAAVYATLVAADCAPPRDRAGTFFRTLCALDASDLALADARADIARAAPDGPRVLDLFAGGGAIPLEAQRLGCRATAVELNPVAHVIERCTLEFPQRYGVRLADEIRRYGTRWIDRTWAHVGHLYPALREPEAGNQTTIDGASQVDRSAGRPIAYLWTRTVPCPNPERKPHVVPLVRQTWLAKKKGHYVALRPLVDPEELTVAWEAVEAETPDALGFDPGAFSKRGSTSCLACGAAVDLDYVKQKGEAGLMGILPLAAVLVKPGGRGRDYFAAGGYEEPSAAECNAVLSSLGVDPPDELIPTDDARNFWTPPYGLRRYRDLFTLRQLATLCAFAQAVRETYDEMVADGVDQAEAAAVCTYLGLILDRVADYCSTLCQWHNTIQKTNHTFARQALPMVWDFSETNPFSSASGSVSTYLKETAAIAEALAHVGAPAEVVRTSATRLPHDDCTFDAVVTDPPYYDNISYADLSDYFYVWLKRSVGFLYPAELGGELTPKSREAIVAPYRFDGSKAAARAFYEREMGSAFAEAHRVLKPGAPLVCVYAHKTTLGWSSLVEALRHAGFTITEAWPLDTEMPERSIGQNTASLASSIFLVARRREGNEVGDAAAVRRELDAVIEERLAQLTEAGVSGSDLVIATIGAALAPFTRYASVELPNGEPLPADRFLEEVQTRVLGAILRTLYGLGDGMGGLDPSTRYYVLARYSYGYADVDFDEANNLARTAGVELSDDLIRGVRPLATQSKGKVHLLDYQERGNDPELGLDRTRLVDVLHGLLWRASHRPMEVRQFLDDTQPDPATLRVIAQALQGRALRAESEQKPPEAQACERLLGSWRTLVEENLFSRP
jgi:putative DNA methylase